MGRLGQFICLNAADGKPVWDHNLIAQYGGKKPQWDYSASPLVDDDKVIVALQKSWGKMTPAGHAEALKLTYAPREQALLERALKPG